MQQKLLPETSEESIHPKTDARRKELDEKYAKYRSPSSYY